MKNNIKSEQEWIIDLAKESYIKGGHDMIDSILSAFDSMGLPYATVIPYQTVRALLKKSRAALR